ncbi:MAG: ribosomal protein S18-alanine N-acetyltransferase [Lachnospiraceae bacterium]|nr:ribosomal protein S18-alanine N-acetyltransferase [Lachnospiraceae bacterium]
MPLNYQIREMQREDLEEVVMLEASCFSMPWKYKDFEEVLTNPDRVYLVALADNPAAGASNRILGGCMLSNAAGEGDITNVAVREEYRNNKIATALLTALLKMGTERYGMTAFTLEVRSQNTAARRLYEKQGFVSLGIRPNFYERPKDDAVIMKRVTRC